MIRIGDLDLSAAECRVVIDALERIELSTLGRVFAHDPHPARMSMSPDTVTPRRIRAQVSNALRDAAQRGEIAWRAVERIEVLLCRHITLNGACISDHETGECRQHGCMLGRR